MKKQLITFLKIALPLALGIFLIWYIYKDLTPTDKENIINSFRKANYSWLVLSIFLGVLSHLSRAHRWLILLKPLGYTPKLLNSFFAVMIGYAANLAFPRLGEVSRCASMSKYENIPFEKLFGTVMAERLIDIILVFSIFFFVIITQLNTLGAFLNEHIFNPLQTKIASAESSLFMKLSIVAIGIIAILGIVKVVKTYSAKLYRKLKVVLGGFLEGFKAIMQIKEKGLFVFHSLFIWAMYFTNFYVCFFMFEETAHAPLLGALSTFVFSSFGVAAVQGGIGAVPAIVTQTLQLYGIPKSAGFALGWISWTAQTAMVILVGLISMVSLPLYNKKVEN